VLAEAVKGSGLSGKLWVGLKKSEVLKLRKLKNSVWIKEGVRFAPSFFLALIATALWGNLFLRIIVII